MAAPHRIVAEVALPAEVSHRGIRTDARAAHDVVTRTDETSASSNYAQFDS
jgi:hypothetical protein